MLSFDTIGQFIKTHPRKAALIAGAVVLYAVFNVWVYVYSTSGRAPKTLKSLNLPKHTPPAKQDLAPPDTPTPTPTPRPTGPGTYACDPYGQCNLYSDEMRKQYCTQTYANSLCLNQCADPAKQCTK